MAGIADKKAKIAAKPKITIKLRSKLKAKSPARGKSSSKSEPTPNYSGAPKNSVPVAHHTLHVR